MTETDLSFHHGDAKDAEGDRYFAGGTLSQNSFLTNIT